MAPAGLFDTQFNSGVFTVSLDFELFWGMADLLALDDDYRLVLGRTRREVIPRLLDTFEASGVHATWATVGMLMFDSIEAMVAGCPDPRPDYADPRLSAYRHLPEPEPENPAGSGTSEDIDPFRLGISLVRRIRDTAHQEIGSHSFSHYYCLEVDSEPRGFEADLLAWREAAAHQGIDPMAICFARNQYDGGALETCREAGFRAFRGNERSWFWQPRAARDDPTVRKLVRYIDAYLPLSRPTCLSLAEVAAVTPHDVAASRFLRAYNPKLRLLEPLKVDRINRMMTRAARQRRVFHLWWHPQDFAVDTDENFRTLDQILATFGRLRDHYGMVSLSMGEVADLAATHPTPADLAATHPTPADQAATHRPERVGGPSGDPEGATR